MKLMKQITIALVVGAIPAMAFAQTVSCDGCDHRVSVYRGSGGFIATADGDAEMVNYRATCNNVTRTGQLTPDSDGIVSMLFTGDLACMEEDDDNAFDLGPVTDGGWFWIHVGDSSAVGNIVARDILENDTVTITDAGNSVTTTTGSGAVLLTHTSGRVGILPNILPEPPETSTPARKCGYGGAGTTADPLKRIATDCELGDGGAIIIGSWIDAHSGKVHYVRDKDNLTRPAGTATVVITFDLWGNGTGHMWPTADGGFNGTNFIRGHSKFHRSGDWTISRLQGATYEVSAGGGPGGGTVLTQDDTTTPVQGVAWAGGSHKADVLITRSEANCSKTENHSTPVTLKAMFADGNGANQVVPSIKTAGAANVAATLAFTVVCP